MKTRLFSSLLLLSGMASGSSRARYAPTGSVPSSARQAVDSTIAPGQLPLTESVLQHFIALKRDLAPFWQAHQTLLAEARAHGHTKKVAVNAGWMKGRVKVYVFDYVTLAAKTPTLAALFTKHQLRPPQFEPIQDAVQAASFALSAGTRMKQPPDTTTAVGRNVVVIKPHRQELAAVGLGVH